MLKVYLILCILQTYFYQIFYNNVCTIQFVLLCKAIFLMIFHYANILLDKKIKIKTVKMINYILLT
jgi:hypothetical protein